MYNIKNQSIMSELALIFIISIIIKFELKKKTVEHKIKTDYPDELIS